MVSDASQWEWTSTYTNKYSYLWNYFCMICIDLQDFAPNVQQNIKRNTELRPNGACVQCYLQPLPVENAGKLNPKCSPHVAHVSPIFRIVSKKNDKKKEHQIPMVYRCVSTVFQYFPIKLGPKLPLIVWEKTSMFFPTFWGGVPPQICKSSHKWVPQLPLRGRSRTRSAAVGLGPAGWGWTRLPARKVAGPPMGWVEETQWWWKYPENHS